VVEQLLETRCSAALCRVFEEESPTTFSVAGGFGLAADLKERLRLEGEIQIVEGVSEAYRAQGGEIRYRTVEVILRVAFPF
jgi:hypothetical protein